MKKYIGSILGFVMCTYAPFHAKILFNSMWWIQNIDNRWFVAVVTTLASAVISVGVYAIIKESERWKQ